MHHAYALCAMATVACLGQAPSSEKDKWSEFYLKDQGTSEEIKSAIRQGLVIKGMCPNQVIAAAGSPGPYMVKADKKKWPPHTPPPQIIKAQCGNPDESVIELMFRNSTQFPGKEPFVFRVRFLHGRVALIDQKKFNED
jgi:hypothetical protein